MLFEGKSVDSTVLDQINKDNNYIIIYYQALSYIKTRQRSKKEINLYLTKKGYEDIIIKYTINKLEKEGYIDDNRFAQSYINDRINLTNDGIYKIRRELINFGIDITIIENYISNINEELIKQKISKIIDKQIKLNTKHSGYKLKNKIFNYLLNLGYDSKMILEYLNKVEIKDDENLQKEFSKLYNKYVTKYDDYQLKKVISQKLYQKGYRDIELETLMIEHN